ncbi:carboxymuconolactone decarboxylase family protein [Rhodovibrionaceae bacterium A322]
MSVRLNYYEAGAKAMKVMLAMEDHLNKSNLEHSLRELVKMRVSQINGCAFCIDMHSRDARAAGETEARLYQLSAWHEAPCFSDRERAALAWTEALTHLADGPPSAELYERMASHFDEEQQVDLTAQINAINAWNRMNVGFAVPPQD